MSDGKRNVVIGIDPNEETTVVIKPFGANLTEVAAKSAEIKASATATGTVTSQQGSPDADGDGDIDF